MLLREEACAPGTAIHAAAFGNGADGASDGGNCHLLLDRSREVTSQELTPWNSEMNVLRGKLFTA